MALVLVLGSGSSSRARCGDVVGDVSVDGAQAWRRGSGAVRSDLPVGLLTAEPRRPAPLRPVRAAGEHPLELLGQPDRGHPAPHRPHQPVQVQHHMAIEHVVDRHRAGRHHTPPPLPDRPHQPDPTRPPRHPPTRPPSQPLGGPRRSLPRAPWRVRGSPWSRSSLGGRLVAWMKGYSMVDDKSRESDAQWTPGDVAAILSNPFTAIQFHPYLSQPHETIIDEETWV